MEHRLELVDLILLILVIAVHRHLLAEVSGRKLLLIASNDQLIAPVYVVDRVRWTQLGSLVKDHEVETHVRSEKLAHRQRTHHEAGLDRESDRRGPLEEVPNRHMPALLLSFLVN